MTESNSGGSYHFVRPFDGSGDGKGYDNWRDMLCAESLAKSLDHVFDGKVPVVPELAGDNSNATLHKMRSRLLEEYKRDAKRMVGQFTKLCSVANLPSSPTNTLQDVERWKNRNLA